MMPCMPWKICNPLFVNLALACLHESTCTTRSLCNTWYIASLFSSLFFPFLRKINMMNCCRLNLYPCFMSFAVSASFTSSSHKPLIVIILTMLPFPSSLLMVAMKASSSSSIALCSSPKLVTTHRHETPPLLVLTGIVAGKADKDQLL